MLWFLAISFAIGVLILMMFSEDGRGCLAGIIGLIVILLVVTALGAAAIFALIYLLV